MSWISGIASEVKLIDTSSKKIRQFGWLWFVVLAMLQVYVLYPFDAPALTLLDFVWIVAGTILLLISYVLPSLLKPLYLIWMGLAIVLGAVVNVIIISIVFYLVITPIGWGVRLTKGDLLNVRPSKNGSYWISRSDDSFVSDLTKQF